MKKPRKTEAAKAAKSATPAQSAPSPATKAKPSTKPNSFSSNSTLTLVRETTPMAAPPLKRFAPLALATTVGAQIDVGFGNTLYIRGEGPGLSWEKGVPLDCVADDKWSISFAETSRPIVFKFLINDRTWCSGDDFVALPGSTLIATPVF